MPRPAEPDLVEPTVNEPIPFLIVSAGRTGSNLLRDLIGSHPGAFCGGEIFNKDFVKGSGIPWPLDDAEHNPELLGLMHHNPEHYVGRLFDMAASKGYRAIGAKLTYENGAAHPAASEHLAHAVGIRVIHLRRRNVLRQYVSLQRAFKTGQWMAKGDSGPPPPIQIDFVKYVWFLLRNLELENTADKIFAQHPKIDITYEELAADPRQVGARCVEFLGLDPNVELQVRHKKSATDTLPEAIENYPALKAQFAEWLSYFDD